MKVGHMYGSNGPHLEFSAVSLGKTGIMGDSLKVVKDGSNVTFSISGNFDGGLNKLLVLKNGNVAETVIIEDTSFDEKVTLFVEPGDYVRVELEGYETANRRFNNDYDSIMQTDGLCAPFAFSNPIFFDEGVDEGEGDGEGEDKHIDKTELNAVIARAEKLDNSDDLFSAASWAAFSGALSAAKAVSANATASQAEIVGALVNLRSAMNALDYIVAIAVVAGPEVLTLTDLTATYRFSLENMPADVSAVTLTFSVEDEFFSGQNLYPLGGWGVFQEYGWVKNGAFWEKTVMLTRQGGALAGNYDVLEIVLVNKGADGLTEVGIVDISAATPGSIVPMFIAEPAITESVPFPIYDVNRDGSVDLADVAAAAYFFMSQSSDLNWTVLYKFETAVSGVYVYVSPQRCDVNKDGQIDIEDLILILANFS
jgi:hypothetical protein